MFSSNYQLAQEPRRLGISIYCFKPGTYGVADIVRTPVPVTSELVKLFNAAPEDDRAAREWGIRADARETNKHLLRWLRGATTSTDEMLRLAPVVHELANRVLQACAASSRLKRAYHAERRIPDNQVRGHLSL